MKGFYNSNNLNTLYYCNNHVSDGSLMLAQPYKLNDFFIIVI